jgi:hypothetical protein
VWCWQNLLTVMGYLVIALLLAVFARGQAGKAEGSGR